MIISDETFNSIRTSLDGTRLRLRVRTIIVFWNPQETRWSITPKTKCQLLFLIEGKNQKI